MSSIQPTMKLKELFFSYFPPTEDDFAQWWNTGIFAFDANALLGLYGLQDETREELLAFLESGVIKERLWVPHQAAFEFSKNRAKVIELQVGKYKAVIGQLVELTSSMKINAEKAQKELADPNLPESIKEVALQVSSDFESLRSKINESVEPLEAEVAKLIKQLEAERDKQAALVESDPILQRLTALLGENIGDAYDEAALTEIYAEGTERYAADPQVPPGFSDKNNKAKRGNEIYGDLLVWKQTIEHAKLGERPILMVNNEQKPDWVESWGQSKRARKELVQEMYQEAKVPFFMYTLPQFMEAAKKYLGASFSANALFDASRVESEEVARLSFNEIQLQQTRSSLYGDFILAWQVIESHLAALLAESGNDNRNVNSSQALDTLRAQGEISDKHHNRLHWLRRFKNTLIQGTGFIVPEANIQANLGELRDIIDELGIKAQTAIAAVSRTLQAMYPTANLTLQRDKPNIFLTRGLEVVAVGVEAVTTMDLEAFNKVVASLSLGDHLVAQGNIDRFVHVVACDDKAVALSSDHMLSSMGRVSNSKVWVGYLEGANFILTTNTPSLHLLFEQPPPE